MSIRSQIRSCVLEMPLFSAQSEFNGYGRAGSVADNRQIDCWLVIHDGVVQSARLEGFAACSTMQACDWLSAWLVGQPIEALESVTGLWIAQATGLAAQQRSDALYIEDALRAALSSYNAQNDEGC